MFTHLGENVIIPTREIVAIVDVHTLQQKDTYEFLQVARQQGRVQQICEKAVSLVITRNEVYLSPISSSTLRRRADERGKVYAE